MVRLTFFGKIVVVLVGLAVFYTLLFVFPGFLASKGPSEPSLLEKRTDQVVVNAFVSCFDYDSVKLVEVLRNLSADPEFKGKFNYSILNTCKYPEKAKEAGIVKTPSFTLNDSLFEGLKEEAWFRDQFRQALQP